MAFSATLGTLVTNLSVNASGFVSGFALADRALGKFAGGVDKLGRSTRNAAKGGGAGMLNSMLSGITSGASAVVGTLSMLATAVGAFIGSVGAMVVSQTARIDQMLGSALQLGVSVQVFQGLQVAASRAGLGMGELTAGLSNVHEALNGTSQEAQRTQAMISSLGFDPSSLQGLTADSELDAIGQMFKEIEDPVQRAQLGVELFGTKWASFVRMMDNDLIWKVNEDLEKTGLALTSLDFAKAEMFQDSWARLKNVFDGIFKKVATELSPAFQALIEMFLDGSVAAGGFGDEIEFIGDAFTVVMKTVLAVGNGIAGVFSVFMTGLSAIASGVAGLIGDVTGSQFFKDYASFAEDNAAKWNEFANARFDSAFSGETGKDFEDRMREIEERAKRRAKELDTSAAFAKPDTDEKAKDKKRAEMKPQELGALIRGSTEAFKAVQESQKMNDLLTVEKKSEGHLAKSKDLLADIRDALKSGTTPPIAAITTF